MIVGAEEVDRDEDGEHDEDAGTGYDQEHRVLRSGLFARSGGPAVGIERSFGRGVARALALGFFQRVVDETHGERIGACAGGLVREGFHVADGPSRIAVVDHVGIVDEGGEDRAVAKIVDDSRDASAGAMNGAHRP